MEAVQPIPASPANSSGEASSPELQQESQPDVDSERADGKEEKSILPPIDPAEIAINTFQGEDTLPQASPDSVPLNDTDAKALEEQANVKRQMEQLLATLGQKEEAIATLERERALLKREVELSTREKEATVVRYATVERTVLDAKQAKEVAEKRLRECQKEVETVNGKMKTLVADKTRIGGLFDAKCQELKGAQKEIERLKNDLSSLEMKGKWSSLKIKQEGEAKAALEKRVEELSGEIVQLKSNEIARVREEVELEKAKITEKLYTEQQATLILLKHGNEEKEKKVEELQRAYNSTQAELSQTAARAEMLGAENGALRAAVDQQKAEIDELQRQLDTEIMKVADLQSKVSEIESLRTQLSLEREELLRTRRDYDVLNSNYEELCQEVEKIRGKETELLQFNRELTERTVKLQNECSLLTSKVTALSVENRTIVRDKSEYDDIISRLEADLAQERRLRGDEKAIAAQQLAERARIVDDVRSELDCALGDLEAARKKHSQTIKELHREMTLLRKRCDQLEAAVAAKPTPTVLVTPNSESEEAEKEQTKSDVSSTSDSESVAAPSESSSGAGGINQIVRQPTKKALIERILRLQHGTARQAEKIDFLENHCASLTAELQKKAKLLQDYMLRDHSGALASAKSDRHKAELAKYGGIMGAVYGGFKGNGSSELTLELSVEINQKLQNLLEDVLLKNITLKENVDTLSLEIDKLTKRLAATSAK